MTEISPAAPRLDVDRVSWSVDGIPIVRNILLDAQPGEFVGLIGPNGSGKSTLLRTIYRVLRPTAGLIALDGASVWEMDARGSARRTAVVAQETTGEFDFSVYEIVLMGRNPHKQLFEQDSEQDFIIVEEALRRVRMLDFAGRSYRSLSGGEKQRVLVARALAQQAGLLVLDEPTNHLDIRYQLEILTLVKQLGVTTLAALHDLSLAAQYCDRLFMLSEGSVVSSGTPEQVLEPQRIRKVYQVDAHIERNTHTGRLQIFYSPLEREEAPHE